MALYAFFFFFFSFSLFFPSFLCPIENSKFLLLLFLLLFLIYLFIKHNVGVFVDVYFPEHFKCTFSQQRQNKLLKLKNLNNLPNLHQQCFPIYIHQISTERDLSTLWFVWIKQEREEQYLYSMGRSYFFFFFFSWKEQSSSVHLFICSFVLLLFFSRQNNKLKKNCVSWLFSFDWMGHLLQMVVGCFCRL